MRRNSTHSSGKKRLVYHTISIGHFTVIIFHYKQPTIKYIDSSNTVTLGNVCGMLIQDQGCQFSNRTQLEWAIDINVDTKPPVDQLNPPPVGDISYVF